MNPNDVLVTVARALVAFATGFVAGWAVGYLVTAAIDWLRGKENDREDDEGD